MFNDKCRKFLRLEAFLREYCPSVTNIKHKMRGIDGNNKPIDFSERDKSEIKSALKRLSKDILE